MTRLKDNEDGAVLIFVALILVVVIGFGSIAVDAGALYQEHRELQNGADAAALSLAQSCSKGNTIAACTVGFADVDAHAEVMADPNAEDDTMDATVDMSQWAQNKVTVTTSTIDGSNAPGQLTMQFAKIFGIDTAATTARTRVKWGSPAMGGIGTLPLVISACEFERFGGVGGGTATAPWTTAQNGPLQVLNFHSGGAAQDCAAQAGQDTDGDNRLPGGFGWIDTTGNCSSLINANGTAPADVGAAPDQNDCSPTYVQNNIYQKVIYVPVFTDLNGLSGNNGAYTLSYYAAFYVAAYNFGGQYKQPAGYQCPAGGSARCLSGWFTAGSYGTGTVGGSTDTGVRVFEMD